MNRMDHLEHLADSGAGRAAALAFAARGGPVARPARGPEGLARAADEVRLARGEALVGPTTVDRRPLMAMTVRRKTHEHPSPQ
ncbi:hypothetical protein [Streptomyces sp. NPDC001020]